jgi:hypothetical protein
MRRSFALPSCVLMLALAPAALFAQTPSPQQPTQQPAQQQPTQQQPPSQQPPAQGTQQQSAPKVGLSTPAGVFLVQIKPAETATFEEMIGKLRAGLAKTEDPTLKQQSAGWKIYKAQEPFGSNALYVIIVDPVVPNAEYDLFAMMQKTMTREELSAPGVADMWKRYSDAFAAGLSRLSLTPLAPAQ